MATPAQQLEEFILENGQAPPDTHVDLDEDLLAGGIIDSVGITQLVSFIEEEFGVPVGDEDLLPENFGSIRKIIDFVDTKQRR